MCTPKVSVIIPTYNNDDVIVENVNSVINQSYKNLEIIIVNDGSTDATKEKLENNFENDESIIIFNQENRGLGYSRNRGITASTGKYILFLDGDDSFLSKEAIEKLVEKSVTEDLDWLVFGFSYTYNNRQNIEKSIQLNQFGMYSAVWNKLYSRDLIKGLRFPEDLKFEDMGFSIISYLDAKNRGILQKSFYGYSQRPGSITKNILDGVERLDALSVLQMAIDQFGDNENKIFKEYINYHFITHLILAIDESNFENAGLIKKFISFHKSNNLGLKFYNSGLKNWLFIFFYIMVSLKFKRMTLYLTHIIVKARGSWRDA